MRRSKRKQHGPRSRIHVYNSAALLWSPCSQSSAGYIRPLRCSEQAQLRTPTRLQLKFAQDSVTVRESRRDFHGDRCACRVRGASPNRRSSDAATNPTNQGKAGVPGAGSTICPSSSIPFGEFGRRRRHSLTFARRTGSVYQWSGSRSPQFGASYGVTLGHDGLSTRYSSRMIRQTASFSSCASGELKGPSTRSDCGSMTYHFPSCSIKTMAWPSLNHCTWRNPYVALGN